MVNLPPAMVIHPVKERKLTRIAPTPSGFLHLGNVLSFAITTALAKAYGARILLRIDDLDQRRTRDDYLSDIFETLDFLDFTWDEGPENMADHKAHFSQVHRMEYYQENLLYLAEQQLLYACTCSRKEIAQISPDGTYPGTCRKKSIPLAQPATSWRFMTGNGPIQLVTPSGTELHPLPPSVKDFVIRKKDGFPAYQLTSVLDDAYFGVDLIVRGQDLFDSSIAQLDLSSCLNEANLQHALFYHHQLLLSPSHQKLSKSKGAGSIKGMRQKGAGKEDIFLELGRRMEFDTPVNSLEEFVSEFQKKTGLGPA